MVRKPALLVPVLFLLAPLAVRAAASPWQENGQSRVRLVTPWKVAPRSGELRLGLHFTLAPGWHVYWKNSGDAGFPPVVVFTARPGLGKPELLWPVPHRFDLPGDLVAFGYAGEVVYPLRAALSSTADRLHLEADVDYLVCEVDCVPYRYTLKLDQPLGEPVPDPETAPLLDLWWSRLPEPPPPGVTTTAALDAGPALEVRVDGVRPGDHPELFLESHDSFDTGRPVAQSTADGVVFRVPLEPREVGKMPDTTTIGWTVTGVVHQGRPVSLEARREIGRKVAEPAVKATTLLRSSVLLIFAAVASVLVALWLWGLLGGPAGRGLTREAFGFAAGAVTIGLLYALSRQIRPERLAFLELALLLLSLVAWLWGRKARI